jgi:hypothetical protein
MSYNRIGLQLHFEGICCDLWGTTCLKMEEADSSESQVRTYKADGALTQNVTMMTTNEITFSNDVF